MNNTTLLTAENIYSIKVAERCDRDFGEEEQGISQGWLRNIINRGEIMDAILCYLKENPRSRCSDVSKNICNGMYSCQKVNSMLRKLCASGFVNREEDGTRAIKIKDDYGMEKAILVTDAFFSLA